MSAAFEPISFEDFHATELPRRLAAVPQGMPEGYVKTLRPLAIRIRETGASTTYSAHGTRVVSEPGDAGAEVVVEIPHESFEHLVHDLESSAGLIYGQRVKRIRGDLMQLLQWEPALRWMYQGRPVYDPDAIDLRDASGAPLDVTRSFEVDDDPEEMAHFLRTAGFLWVRDVISPEEVEKLRAESERLREAAREGDQESWWGKREDGSAVLCRVLRAGKEPTIRSLHGDSRLRRIVALCDVEMVNKQGPEEKDGLALLYKQPGVSEGLGDLPWHRDCGMGGHASMCPTAVMSIFLGPNTPEAGQLRFLPGSWQMSFPFVEATSEEGPAGVAPAAEPGDVTLHYGDGVHVAPPPTNAEGPWRRCILMGFQRADGGHHRGGRHYNDVLLGDESGQVEHMSKLVERS